MKFLTLRLPTNKLQRMALLTASLGGVVVFLSLLFIYNSLHQPMQNSDETSALVIEQGSSLSRVASQLEESDRYPHPQLFKLLAAWRSVADQIKVGEYEIEPGLSAADLLAKLVNGDTLQYRLTLVEGISFRAALETIWQSEKIVVSLRSASDQELAALLGVERDNPEGMLFPDTYFYTAGTSDREMLQRAHDSLQRVLAAAWETRLGALPLDNEYEALTLASIIEKESASGSERGHIAGVFTKRLETGMRLQSDPTVIYGMGDAYAGDIRRSDLTTSTAYNTYRINGLPPTPIALAGRESIEAALNPLLSDYLYFVSKGDGSHYFSATLDEHNAAVNRYQRQTTQ